MIAATKGVLGFTQPLVVYDFFGKGMPLFFSILNALGVPR
jgi:hypothetical protein